MKTGWMVAAGAAVLFTAGPASAFEFGTPATTHPYRTAQNFALELRFSPYEPSIDDEPALNGRTPFANTFGSGSSIMPSLEFDWQAFRIPGIGVLGPGAGIGIYSKSSNVTTVSGRNSGDDTGFTLYPLWLVAVLRVDVLWRSVGIPFVPYVKAGVGAGFWRATNTGETSSVNGVSGRGVSLGPQLAVGLQFVLNGLDEGAARSMDASTGINATSLFVEGYSLSLNGFGSANTLRVGDTTWAAGLAVEF